ncbi:Hypothetical_protein [Hexamita inflata]|nr:Hypothetical protein HINF_LOCUS27679 [Hexamita inflata]CAI9943720.1 Hypothetical protein HINF_LOCUS31365 [Hexamita inflata]
MLKIDTFAKDKSFLKLDISQIIHLQSVQEHCTQPIILEFSLRQKFVQIFNKYKNGRSLKNFKHNQDDQKRVSGQFDNLAYKFVSEKQKTACRKSVVLIISVSRNNDSLSENNYFKKPMIQPWTLQCSNMSTTVQDSDYFEYKIDKYF